MRKVVEVHVERVVVDAGAVANHHLFRESLRLALESQLAANPEMLNLTHHLEIGSLKANLCSSQVNGETLGTSTAQALSQI